MKHPTPRPRSARSTPSQLTRKRGHPRGLPAQQLTKLDLKRSVYDLLEVAWRGKWLILGVLLLVVAGAAYYTHITPRIYQAQSLLILNLGSNSESEALKSGVIEPFNPRELTNELIVLQQSLPIAERTVERLRAVGTIPGTDRPLPLVALGEQLPNDLLARILQDGYIRVNPTQRTSAFQITATSTEPAEAALIANIYAEEYVKRAQETSRQRITGSRVFLEEQLAERRRELDGLEEGIQQYQSSQQAVALDSEANYLLSQLSQLDLAADEARIDLEMKQHSLRSLEAELEQIQPRLAQHIASSAKAELDQSQAKIAELELLVEQIYTRNPELRTSAQPEGPLSDLKGQIDHLRERVAVLSEQYMQEMLEVGGAGSTESGMAYVSELRRRISMERIAVSGAEAKLAAVQNRRTQNSRKLGNIPGQTLELAQLSRAHDTTEELYLQLLERLQEVQIAEQSEIGFARIIRPAAVPPLPIQPNKTRNLSLGIVLGLMLGFAAAVARAGLDTRIHTPHDLRKTGLPLLGSIPDLRALIREEFKGKPTVSTEGGEVRTTLLPLLSPTSPPAQAYRQLYLNLQFLRREMPAHLLLVTSPEADVGKSTTTLNMAITMAQARKRTLIIDADLYHPSIDPYLNRPHRVGLEEVLRGGLDHLDITQLATSIEDVYVIASAAPASNPAELLASEEMSDLLYACRSIFDEILIDAPPILATAEAALLASRCDATLLVARAGQTDAEALKHAAAELEAVGGVTLGAVLNRFDPSRAFGYQHTYGYRSKYYYKYGLNSAANERGARRLLRLLPARTRSAGAPSPS